MVIRVALLNKIYRLPSQYYRNQYKFTFKKIIINLLNRGGGVVFVQSVVQALVSAVVLFSKIRSLATSFLSTRMYKYERDVNGLP